MLRCRIKGIGVNRTLENLPFHLPDFLCFSEFLLVLEVDGYQRTLNKYTALPTKDENLETRLYSITGFTLSASLYSRFSATVNLFLSLPNQYISHYRSQEQETKFNLGLVLFHEFNVVFTVSSFMGNPVCINYFGLFL